MLVAKQKFARRTQHAVRFDAADGSNFERLAGHGNDRARAREHALHAGVRIGCSAHHLDRFAGAVVHHAEFQLVGVGMLLRGHDLGDHERLQPRASVLDGLDLKADRRQLLRNRCRLRIRVQMLLEPGKREFHRDSPPSREGMSSAANP